MPKFSICIPTRERHQTLPYSIRTVLAQTFSDFELIVQDNCSSEETRKAVQEFDDGRIIYHRSTERLSMHANWEQALNLTSGDYLIFIGDDDGLQPNCLAKLDELTEGRNVELLAWLAHTYYWPNVPDVARRNHLTLDLRPAAAWAESFSREKALLDRSPRHASLPPGVFCLDSRQLLRNWLTYSGSQVYVPAYHNLVARRLIERVRVRTGGVYFFNPLPDFGTLIANLYEAEEVFFYASALSMTGHAGGSSGGTHGDLASWRRTLERFIAEAQVSPEELLPSVFDPFLWNPPILAGCFENVKRQLFPHEHDLEMNWENFLRSAATQVEAEPDAVREHCRAWILASAAKLGVSPASIEFPKSPGFTRQVGLLCDPLGKVQFQFIDADAWEARSVVDAVAIAAQFQPIALYPTQIPWSESPDSGRVVPESEPMGIVRAFLRLARSGVRRLRRLERRILERTV